MAACTRCNTEVGCGCNLIQDKWCSNCYTALIQQRSPEVVEPNTCNQSLEALEAKLIEVEQKYENKKARRKHYVAIIKSQIRLLDLYPCKYYKKISEM